MKTGDSGCSSPARYGLARSRRSGRIPALPYLPPRSKQCTPKYQSRCRKCGYLSRKCLRNYASQGITDLVLSSATSLAGFEVSTYGRFSGVHRGIDIRNSPDENLRSLVYSIRGLLNLYEDEES